MPALIPPSDDSGWQSVALDGAASLSLDGGYRLWTRAPAGEAPSAGWPVLWLLDGAGLFPVVAEAVRLLARRPDATGVPPMLVAAIDHDPPDKARRDIDYSFGPPRDPAGFARATGSGGGDRLLELLAGPALHAVTARHAVDPVRQALLGHSLAGFFALNAVALRPGLFRVAGAISPSIWWDEAALHALLERMPDKGQSVFIGAGSREEPNVVRSDADRRRQARGMVTRARAAAAIAGRRLGEDRAVLAIGEDEDHASAPLALLPRFLRFAARHF